RGNPQHYTYSKVMAWVAADRFLKLSVSRKTQDVRRQKRIARLRDLIHETVCRDGFNRQRNSFGESFGADTVDASLLLLPAVGFLPVSDPRIAGTIAAVETDLIEDGLVRRHRRPDSGKEEGAFIACTCWL